MLGLQVVWLIKRCKALKSLALVLELMREVGARVMEAVKSEVEIATAVMTKDSKVSRTDSEAVG